MFRFIGLCLGTLVRLLRARRGLLLENLALRQQLAVLKPRHPRPRLDLLDKLCWVAVRRFWSGWQQSLIAVTPETVVSWHKCQFRLKIPHCTGRKFPTPEPHEWASFASDGVEPSAVFWRVLGVRESEAKERAAASAPSCPRGGTRPALRRSFSR